MSTEIIHRDQPCDLFNRATLELTFTLLRRRQPALALQIQNALVSIFPRNDYHSAFTAAELPLCPDCIAQIAHALAVLNDELQACGSSQNNELIMVRGLLLDWLMLEREIPSSAA